MNLAPKFQLQRRLAALQKKSSVDPSIIALNREELEKAINVLEGREAIPTIPTTVADVGLMMGAEDQITVPKKALEELVSHFEGRVKILNDSAYTQLNSAVRKLSESHDRDMNLMQQAIVASMHQVSARASVNTVVINKQQEVEASYDFGTQHEEFDTLLKLASARLHAFLVGPAGSGKTTAAKHVAKALNMPFYFNGAIENEYKLLGFIDANSKVVSKPFREAFLNGGVYLFDEVDASLPSAVLAFNAALANGRCDFPDGCMEAHPDFICLAAGNTFYGADHQYVGRTKQDGAFLDRFQVLEWGYDRKLESSIALSSHNDKDLCNDWLEMIWKAREEAASRGLHVIISPRATSGGLRAMGAGITWQKAVELNLRKTMKESDWLKIEPFTKQPARRSASTTMPIWKSSPPPIDRLADDVPKTPVKDEIESSIDWLDAFHRYESTEATRRFVNKAKKDGIILNKKGIEMVRQIMSDRINATSRLTGVLKSSKCREFSIDISKLA